MPDENRTHLAAVERAVADRGALVPALFEIEIRNVILMAQRRGRIDRREFEIAMAKAQAMPIEVDREPDLPHVVRLAATHSLTAYDAIYLELALRRGFLLATADRRLLAVAATLGTAFG